MFKQTALLLQFFLLARKHQNYIESVFRRRGGQASQCRFGHWVFMHLSISIGIERFTGLLIPKIKTNKYTPLSQALR